MKIISLMIGTIIFLMGIFSSCKKRNALIKMRSIQMQFAYSYMHLFVAVMV